VKLHLGCGDVYIPGWIHVDARKLPHVDRHDPLDALDIEDNSASYIYACHVLEHFPRARVTHVLREWHRVLEPNGILRVAVPDFGELVKLYRQTGDIELIHGPLYGRQDYSKNIHYTAFDQRSLVAALLGAGFVSAQRYDWRKTEHADMDDYSQSYYPHMNKEYGQLLSLNMEALK